jgi:hypothetical protein
MARRRRFRMEKVHARLVNSGAIRLPHITQAVTTGAEALSGNHELHESHE